MLDIVNNALRRAEQCIHNAQAARTVTARDTWYSTATQWATLAANTAYEDVTIPTRKYDLCVDVLDACRALEDQPVAREESNVVNLFACIAFGVCVFAACGGFTS